MAEGLTYRRWTLMELMSLRVPQQEDRNARGTLPKGAYHQNPDCG